MQRQTLVPIFEYLFTHLIKMSVRSKIITRISNYTDRPQVKNQFAKNQIVSNT